MALTFGSLFAGIGGFDLGFERAGMKCAWQVEIDDYATKILEKHWPDVRRWRDVRTWPQPDTAHVDIIIGGPPCQPASVAGRQQGDTDERWLWGETIRILGDLQPRVAVLENPPGLFVLHREFGDILRSLAEIGFDVEWNVLSASDFGAPHIRERVFIVAYTEGVFRAPIFGDEPHRILSVLREHTKGDGCTTWCGQRGQPEAARRWWAEFGGNSEGATNAISGGCEGIDGRRAIEVAADRSRWWAVEPGLDRVAYGIPNRVDRMRTLGNAVVPQVAQWIGERIVEAAGENQPKE